MLLTRCTGSLMSPRSWTGLRSEQLYCDLGRQFVSLTKTERLWWYFHCSREKYTTLHKPVSATFPRQAQHWLLTTVTSLGIVQLNKSMQEKFWHHCVEAVPAVCTTEYCYTANTAYCKWQQQWQLGPRHPEKSISSLSQWPLFTPAACSPCLSALESVAKSFQTTLPVSWQFFSCCFWRFIRRWRANMATAINQPTSSLSSTVGFVLADKNIHGIHPLDISFSNFFNRL